MAAPSHFTDLPAPARRYVLAFWTAAGAGVTYKLLSAPVAAGAWGDAAFFAAAIGVGHFMRTPSREHSYMLSGPFVLAASLVLPSHQAAAAIALGLLPEKIRSRSAWYTKVFNYLLYLAGGLLAAELCWALTRTRTLADPNAISAGLAAAALFTATNLTAIALAVKFTHRLKLQTFLTPTAVLANLAIDGAGPAMAALWQVSPPLIILGAIPLAAGSYALWLPQLKEELRLDPKTGLYNVRFALDSLHALVRTHQERREPLAVIMADLDHLRDINTRFGHLTGDRALRAFADIFRSHVPDKGITARFGGEEFFAILPGQTVEEAALIAGAVRQALRTARVRTDLPGEETTVTVSIGAAELSARDHDATDLLHRADMALYEAKQGGRDRVAIAPSAWPAARGTVPGHVTGSGV